MERVVTIVERNTADDGGQGTVYWEVFFNGYPFTLGATLEIALKNTVELGSYLLEQNPHPEPKPVREAAEAALASWVQGERGDEMQTAMHHLMLALAR